MLVPGRRLASALVAAGAYAAAATAARLAGFEAISDDDFARVVLAQAQSLSPRLDPTGSSWLPAPFWLQGLVMAALGPSLAVARASSVVLAAASGALLTAAGSLAGLGPGASLLAALLALAWPLVPLLGAATVPELPVAAAVALGLCLLARPAPPPSRWLAGAALLLAASLARYESWTPCALVALAALRAARRSLLAGRRRDAALTALAALLAAAGPPLWILWNLHAHGDPLAFVRRVASYRAGLGAVSEGLGSYPLALLREAPVALAGGLLAAWRWPGLRPPVGAALATVAALTAAEIRGGAPTHHPERALLGPALVLLIASVAWLRASPPTPLHGRGQGSAEAVDRPASPHREPTSLLPLSTTMERGLRGEALLVLALLLAGASRWRTTWQGLGADRRADEALGHALAGALPPGDRALLLADSYGFFATEAALARPGALVARVPRSVDPRSVIVGDPLADPDSLARLRAALPPVRWLLRRPGQAPWLASGPDARSLPGGAQLVPLP